MLTENEVAEVRQYFAVFAGPPSVALEPEGTEEESYIFIERGGLSIGKHLTDVPALGGTVKAYRYLVYNHEGEDDGEQYTHLDAAVRAAMGYYADELFRRVNDKIVTNALAKEYLEGKPYEGAI